MLIEIQHQLSACKSPSSCSPQKQLESVVISTWDLGTGEDDAVDFYSLCGGEIVSAGGEKDDLVTGETHVLHTLI